VLKQLNDEDSLDVVIAIEAAMTIYKRIIEDGKAERSGSLHY